MRVLALVAAGALLSGVGSAAQSTGPSGLQIGYRVEEHFWPVYTERSRQSYLFFQGEPILFRIQIGNLGPEEITFVTDTPERRQPFRVQAVKAPPLPPNFIGDRPVADGGRRFQDERDINLEVEFLPPVRRAPGQDTVAIELQRETVLSPRDSIDWIMNVPSAGLEPGLYRVEVRANVSERGTQPLTDFVNIGFEVRAPGTEAQPEFLRREALRRVNKEDYPGARKAIEDLLRIYPNSVNAYWILARIAAAEGKVEEAAIHERQAEAIIDAGTDTLRAKYGLNGLVP